MIAESAASAQAFALGDRFLAGLVWDWDAVTAEQLAKPLGRTYLTSSSALSQ